MRDQGRVNAAAKWACFAAALLIAATWVASRWIALDAQTGTRMILGVDQGMAVFIIGDAPVEPAQVELIHHERDQVAWQWWISNHPSSLLLPLWVPFLVFASIGLWMSRPRGAQNGRALTNSQGHRPARNPIGRPAEAADHDRGPEPSEDMPDRKENKREFDPYRRPGDHSRKPRPEHH